MNKREIYQNNVPVAFELFTALLTHNIQIPMYLLKKKFFLFGILKYKRLIFFFVFYVFQKNTKISNFE